MAKKVRVKPGKAQSMLGFIMGVIFLLVGIFVAIPTFSGFGVLWTFGVIAIMVVNGYNAFSEKGIDTHIITIDDFDSENVKVRSAEERLSKLKEMYEKELITLEEYEAKKKEIIDEI